jgi:hypothetical protein
VRAAARAPQGSWGIGPKIQASKARVFLGSARRAGKAAAPGPGGAGSGHCGSPNSARGAGRRRGSACGQKWAVCAQGGGTTLGERRGPAPRASWCAGVQRNCDAGMRPSPTATTYASPLVPKIALCPRCPLRSSLRSCLPLPSAASLFLRSSPQPPGHSLVALGRSELRRCDSRVLGLPVPAAREQQAHGICGLRTGRCIALVCRLLRLPEWICRTSFFQAAGQRSILITSA